MVKPSAVSSSGLCCDLLAERVTAAAFRPRQTTSTLPLAIASSIVAESAAELYSSASIRAGVRPT